jgi:hypothetical protein
VGMILELPEFPFYEWVTPEDGSGTDEEQHE